MLRLTMQYRNRRKRSRIKEGAAEIWEMLSASPDPGELVARALLFYRFALSLERSREEAKAKMAPPGFPFPELLAFIRGRAAQTDAPQNP